MVFPEFYMSDDTVPLAFCHYSHEITDGQELVCDIQGVQTANGEYLFTDPQIHSRTAGIFGSSIFGAGDMGRAGILNFFKGHTCSATCKKLGLENNIVSVSDEEKYQAAATMLNVRMLAGGVVLVTTVLSTAVWLFVSVLPYYASARTNAQAHDGL
jgi:hypothetical protein